MNFQDRTLACSDCNCAFIFSAQEQAMYYERRYANAPKRCPACREARKAKQAAAGNPIQNNGCSSFSTRQMFPAVCSDCGKATTIPFEPNPERPVYCLDCYRKSRAAR